MNYDKIREAISHLNHRNPVLAGDAIRQAKLSIEEGTEENSAYILGVLLDILLPRWAVLGDPQPDYPAMASRLKSILDKAGITVEETIEGAAIGKSGRVVEEIEVRKGHYKSIDRYDVNKNLKVTVDPGNASPEVISDILSDLSIIYRRMGGSGINFTLNYVSVFDESFV